MPYESPCQVIGSSLVDLFGRFLANQSGRSLWQVPLALACSSGIVRLVRSSCKCQKKYIFLLILRPTFHG